MPPPKTITYATAEKDAALPPPNEATEDELKFTERQQQQKEQRKAAAAAPNVGENCTVFERHRSITVDQDSTCLDYMLPISLLCCNCNAFRTTYMMDPILKALKNKNNNNNNVDNNHNDDDNNVQDGDLPDQWPSYKAIRIKVIQDGGDVLFHCLRPFDPENYKGGINQKRMIRRVCKFVHEYRTVNEQVPPIPEFKRTVEDGTKKRKRKTWKEEVEARAEALVAGAGSAPAAAPASVPAAASPAPAAVAAPAEPADTQKECLGWAHDTSPTYLGLILQSAQEANNKAIRAGNTIPNEFPVTSVYKDCEGCDQLHIVKEPKNKTTTTLAVPPAPARPAADARQPMLEPFDYHYVLRASTCSRVYTGSSHKLCPSCSQWAGAANAIATCANQGVSLKKRSPLTDADIARVAAAPEALPELLGKLREEHSKELAVARRQFRRLQERFQQLREAGSKSTNQKNEAQHSGSNNVDGASDNNAQDTPNEKRPLDSFSEVDEVENGCDGGGKPPAKENATTTTRQPLAQAAKARKVA